MGMLNNISYGLSGVGIIGIALLINAPAPTAPEEEDDEPFYTVAANAGSDSGSPQNKSFDSSNVPKGTGPTPWLDSAFAYDGLKETGDNRGELIDQWNTKNGGKLGDAWCASFVNEMLAANGIQGTNDPWSQSFKSWGVDAGGPVTGSVVVFDFGAKGGHVGFVHSVNPNGTINVLGGNQGNGTGVQISQFTTENIVAYRLPTGHSGGGINTHNGGPFTAGGGAAETR